MVIDRRVALLQSSNIQDNDNLEMMVRLEGPIVDAFYDTALISWGKALEPPLPMLDSPAASAPPPSLAMAGHANESSAAAVNGEGGLLPELTTQDPHYDETIEMEARRVNDTVRPRQGETRTQAVTRHLSMMLQIHR